MGSKLAGTELADRKTKNVVLWNPRAGRARGANGCRELLISAPDTQFIETESNAHAIQLATDASAQDTTRLIIAGGDGTVNAVLNGLLKRDCGNVELAVVPTGTANDFAFTLAMPDELSAAAIQALYGQARALDVVACRTDLDTRFYANVAAGGNSDKVTRCLTEELKQPWGAFCYLRGAVDVLGDLRSFRVNIRWEDEPEVVSLDLWNIIVAYGRTNAGRLKVAPRANPEDGLLDVILIRDGSVGDLAELMTRFIASDYLDSERVEFRQVRRFQIDSHPPLRFSIDGEQLDQQPIEFRCLPQAIPFVVGDDYQPVP